MTGLATERNVNLVMTNQAISHTRKIRLAHLCRFFQTPMAGLTSILSIEESAFIARRREILLRINSPSNYWSHIAHFQMLLMAKLRQRRRPRSLDSNGPGSMTTPANRLGREQIILNTST